MIVGPSGSGKTRFLAEYILYDASAIYPPPDRIVYYYHTDQPLFRDMYNKVLQARGIAIEFIQGQSSFALDNFDASKNNLVIFDDLFRQTKDSEEVAQLWYIGSHHRSITAVIIAHNLFPKGKVSRELALNTHYLVIFPHRADFQSFATLAQRLEPANKRKILIETFLKEIAAKAHQALIIDLRPGIDPRLKYRTCFGLAGSPGYAYVI